MKYEMNIITNDGWVVTLITDKPIDFGDAVMSSIIVQPKKDHDSRIAHDPSNPHAVVQRSEYRLRMER